MSITAKEIAKKLNLSSTAVSMALNNKPGVSEETRRTVIEEAEKGGYDFSKIMIRKKNGGLFYYISYASHSEIIAYPQIGTEVSLGIEQVCSENGYAFRSSHIYGAAEKLDGILEDLRITNCSGIVLSLSTQDESVYKKFLSLKVPIILTDCYYDSVDCHSVMINNVQGARLAARYLISRYESHPGYLEIAPTFLNFSERRRGFDSVLLENGLPLSGTVVHRLSGTIEGAFLDMLSIIDSGARLARSYFADNDLIAIGAIKAFKLRGYRIPDDVAVIGFDNIRESRIIEPALTTISIPWYYMGNVAAKILFDRIKNPVPHCAKVEIGTSLVKRFSA